MDLNYRVNYFPLIPFYKAEEILINPIVIAEMLIGFKLGTKEEQNKNESYEFLDSPRLSVIEIGEMTAEHYSNIFLQLKKSGKPIPTNDIWIAASAMENDMPLATFDKHFSNIQGPLLVPWLY
jgi:predicted nucleic acid-binding protein